MFDEEDMHDDVMDTVENLLQETVLDLLEENHETIRENIMEDAVIWLEAHHTAIVEAIPVETPVDLLMRPQTTQHSVDWYAQRRNCLTASEFAHILDGRRGALMKSKLALALDSATAATATAATPAPVAPIAISQPDGEMNATSWGHRFESVVRSIYEIEMSGKGTVNDSLGRFTHTDIPWLKASPDGVVVSGPLAGRLLEIKAPKSRKPGLFVPSDYYYQMQIQMEVCDMPAVDFVEAQFMQRPNIALTEEDRHAISAARYKGRIRICGFLERPETWFAQYSEPVEELEDALLPPNEDPDTPILEESTWWLTGWFPRTVLRNDEWWHTKGWPEAQLFWAEVESLRQESDTLPVKGYDVIVHEGEGWLGRKC